MRPSRTVVLVAVLALLAMPVAAHVPAFPTDNTSPDRAVEVPDAAKSWSFYDRLEPATASYYRVSLSDGQRLQVGAFTPVSGAFTPSIVVMSPSLNATADVPQGVTVPEGMGAIVVEGVRPATARYEPFAPSANYHTASVRRPVETETTFLVAIYEPANRSGPAGVALGYEESFSLVEYVTVPFDLVRAHSWEGQHPLVAVGPFVLALLFGLAVLVRRGVWSGGWGRLAVGAAGVALVASGVNTAVQMTLALARTGPTTAALVTAAFVAIPALAGCWAVWRALEADRPVGLRTRAGFAVAGLLGLCTWAGFVVAPAVLLVAAVIPALTE